MANTNNVPSTKDVKEKIKYHIKEGQIEYMSSFAIKYGLKYNHAMYAILFDPSTETGGRLSTKKYIFKVLNIFNESAYSGPRNEAVSLVNICDGKNTGGSFTKKYSKQLLIQFADLVKLLTAEELKAVIHRNHILKYAEILKAKLAKNEKGGLTEEQKEVKETFIPEAEFPTNIKCDYIKVNKMKNEKIDNMLKTNSESAKTASAIAAGATINKVVMEKLRPQLPMMIRGYADSPLADVIVANLVVFAVQNFAANNDKAQWVSEAMLTAAMTNFMSSFNLEGLINDVLESAQVDVPSVEH